MTDPNAEREEFVKLLAYLKQNRNFVPSAALLKVFEQACAQRMNVQNASNISAYQDILEVNSGENEKLFELTLGTRDAFFKDANVWQFLKEEFIPKILTKRQANLRFWVIECGRGHETYSLAMLLCEALGQARFQEQVKIFATDSNEENLYLSRSACFPQSDLKNVPEELIKRYFVPLGKDYVFNPELRRSVIFGRHSVIEDPCLSRMDLIVCRQVLTSMNIEIQKKVLSRLRFSLRDEGLLLLAEGEVCAADSGFKESNGNPRFYRRTMLRPAESEAAQSTRSRDDNELVSSNETVFDCSPIAHFSIDKDGLLATANSKARIIFGITPNDYGKPFQDLEISYRPIELRSLIDQIAKKNSPIVVTRIPRHTSGKTQFFDVYVQPMIESDGDRIGVCVQFDDVTEFYEMQDQLSSVNQQLQDANEELQSAHEELETINEELQSTNEELETTNEELQSTNEELETMNEELQSTNSELEIANEDQQKLASKVEQTNSFLEAILSSMRSCVIVLNEKYQILVWNDYCRELWGMRVEEVKGQSLFELDIGLPLQQLKTPLRTFINLKKTYDEIKLKAVNRRGRNIDCTVRVTPLNNPKEPGVILLIEDE